MIESAGWARFPRFALPLIPFLFAGCTAAPAPYGSGLGEADTEADSRVSNIAGAIEGTVIDESLNPVANASITLTRPNALEDVLATSLTGSDGGFGFALLQPGAYVVSAEAQGQFSKKAVVEVAALEVSTVRLRLGAAPSAVPYVELYLQNGIIRCVASALVWPGEPYLDPACGASTYILGFDVPDEWKKLVGETHWPMSSDSMLTWYTWANQTAGAYTAGLAEGIGKSPVRVELVAGTVPKEKARAAPAGSVWVDIPTVAFRLETRNYYTGILQSELNQTFSQQCYAVFGFTCFGVGAAVEHRFAQYVTVFVRDAPADVSTYSALPDG